jgi:hypothetical protein
MSFSTYLTKIAGISIYPVLSLALFVGFFIAVTLYAWHLKKTTISKLENLPFEEK